MKKAGQHPWDTWWKNLPGGGNTGAVPLAWPHVGLILGKQGGQAARARAGRDSGTVAKGRAGRSSPAAEGERAFLREEVVQEGLEV